MKEARVFDVWNRLSTVILSGKVTRHVKIVCKGGTALNKIFLGKLQRFSEDLDFDAFFSKASLDRDEKTNFLQENIMHAIEDDYTVDRPRVMREVVRFTCSFTNEMKQRDSVFVEFNVETCYVGRVVKARARSSILRLTSVTIPVYSFHTLVAKKLKAFYDRERKRHL